MTKSPRFDSGGTARFITSNCAHRLNIFEDGSCARLFLQEVVVAREKHEFRLFGYAVMPEHIHLVLHPQTSFPMSR